MKFVACTAMCITAWASAAHADLVYTLQAKQMQMTPPATTTIQLSLAGDRLAVEPEPGTKGPHMVFRGDKNLLWTLDPSTKTYIEMNGAMMKSLAAEMAPAMAQMKEQLKGLPPDQRAKAEEVMNAQMGGAGGGGAEAKDPTVEIKNTGEKQTIAGYPCTHYDVLRDGKKISEVWAADWSAAHVKKEEFAALKSMGNFLDELRRSSPMMRHNNDSVVEMTRVDGFPVLVRQYSGDKLIGETALQKVESKSVDASTFELPKDYTERKIGRPKE